MAKEAKGRNEAKRQQRLNRKAARDQERRAAARRARLFRWALVAALVIVGAATVFLLTRPEEEIAGVERPPNRGREHVATGQDIAYESATPTSGSHWPQAPRCGTFAEPLDAPLAVHALEHGAVVLWHRADLPEDEVDELVAIARRWDSHVIVTPNPDIDEAVVATAWNRLMRYDEVGEPVAEFVDVYRRRGPERVDCPA